MPRTALLIVLLAATPALAFDPFEIQVYDGTADAADRPGLEIHVNRHHDATQVTFEPSFGITDFWEVGGYFLTRQGHYQGYKLRTKLVFPAGNFRLGVNLEGSVDVDDNWGGEIRPIIAWENDHFLFAANPNISFPAAFEPCAMAKIKLGPVAVGPEYYGTFPGNENYLFGAIDLIAVKDLEVNFGIGGGTATVAKLIFGYSF